MQPTSEPIAPVPVVLLDPTTEKKEKKKKKSKKQTKEQTKEQRWKPVRCELCRDYVQLCTVDAFREHATFHRTRPLCLPSVETYKIGNGSLQFCSSCLDCYEDDEPGCVCPICLSETEPSEPIAPPSPTSLKPDKPPSFTSIDNTFGLLPTPNSKSTAISTNPTPITSPSISPTTSPQSPPSPSDSRRQPSPETSSFKTIPVSKEGQRTASDRVSPATPATSPSTSQYTSPTPSLSTSTSSTTSPQSPPSDSRRQPSPETSSFKTIPVSKEGQRTASDRVTPATPATSPTTSQYTSHTTPATDSPMSYDASVSGGTFSKPTPLSPPRHFTPYSLGTYPFSPQISPPLLPHLSHLPQLPTLPYSYPFNPFSSILLDKPPPTQWPIPPTLTIPDPPIFLEVSKDGVIRAYSLESGAKVPVEIGLILKVFNLHNSTLSATTPNAQALGMVI